MDIKGNLWAQCLTGCTRIFSECIFHETWHKLVRNPYPISSIAHRLYGDRPYLISKAAIHCGRSCLRTNKITKTFLSAIMEPTSGGLNGLPGNWKRQPILSSYRRGTFCPAAIL